MRSDDASRELYNAFHSLGVSAADTVFVSSDIIRLWATFRKEKKAFEPQMLIHTLMDLVTSDGTLLFPTYNWDFCKGIAFDYNKTKSKSGSLGDVALKVPGFRRTQHPIYSFAVWGKDRDKLCSLENNSGLGPDSPFQYLHEQNATNLVIGVDFNHCFTFAHYVEETQDISYRYLKPFTAPYIDANGNKSIRTYAMYVRVLDMNVINIPDIIPFVEKNIVEKTIEQYGTYFKVLHLGRAFEVFRNDIIHNRGRNFVSYDGQ